MSFYARVALGLTLLLLLILITSVLYFWQLRPPGRPPLFSQHPLPPPHLTAIS